MRTRSKRVRKPVGGDTAIDSSAHPVTSADLHSRLLPDEIVKEIVCQSGLVISEEDFINTNGKVSPFADPTHVSSSAILVVCKQWLRVATPLLYHTVVLRSKSQAEALKSALGRKNKVLGSYIKWLRMEAHYGAVMKSILEAAPNITDLCFTLTLWPHDSASGLAKMLPMLQPRRLILYEMDSNHQRPGSIARSKELLLALFECIAAKWKLMERVLLGPRFSHGILDSLAGRLHEAPALRTVYAQSLEGYNLWFDMLSTNPSLQTIEVPCYNPWVGFQAGSRLWSLVQVSGKSWHTLKKEDDLARRTENVASSSLPILASAKFDDSIWRCIVASALDVTHNDMNDDTLSGNYGMDKWGQNRLHLLLTCKTFFRLGIEYLHSGMFLFWKRLPRVAEHIDEHPELIQQIQHIVLYAAAGHPNRALGAAAAQPLFDDALNTIFQRTHLVSFGAKSGSPINLLRAFPLHWKSLDALSIGSSSTLIHLNPIEIMLPPAEGRYFPGRSFFSPFTNLRGLRTLGWVSSHAIAVHNLSQVPGDMLSSLEEIDYEERVVDVPGGGAVTFLAALSQASLPTLKKVRYCHALVGATLFQNSSLRSFLAAHGLKIVHLRLSSLDMVSPFEYCPNLAVFTISRIDRDDYYPSTKPREELYSIIFCCPFKHSSLEKIVVLESRWRESNNDSCASCIWHPSTYSSFPSLREIHMPNLCRWPTSEREGKVVGWHWPERAEKLHEGNIRLTNREGKHCNPRLRPKRGRKKA